jgi:hypothetical protein
LNDSHQRKVQGTHYLAVVTFLAFVCTSLSPLANAGIRAPGKYSGVVIYDRWGGCILFSGVYLMYISEAVKDQLRPYAGEAVEIDALAVVQPTNPGDGLIRKLKVLGPAGPNKTPFTFDGIKLDAQPKAVVGSRMGVELTIANENDTPARIDSSQLGFVLLSERVEGATSPSDGPSTAVITRANVFYGKGTWEFGVGGKVYSYSYFIADDARLPQTFELPPHESRRTQIAFQLPAGHYQFWAGYGGGVHEAKSVVSNPVSIDLW